MIDPVPSCKVGSGRFSNEIRNTKTQITMYSTNCITPDSAPVTTQTRIEGLSHRYSHIPTTQIVNTIREAGWEFTSGTARKGRTPERIAHAAHVLRFSNANLPEVNGNRIEAVLLNSHDGSTAFELGFGIYRLACANGLVVRTATVGSVRLVHSGLNLDNVFTAARNLADRAPEVASTIERWSNTRLDHDLSLQMSSRMAKARWGNRFVEADLLSPRRMEDTTTDLWTTFNRVQESVIRGGMDVTLSRPVEVEGEVVRVVNTTRKATAIRGALKQMRLNQDLFAIASEYAWN
jgi:hypothetical protein